MQATSTVSNAYMKPAAAVFAVFIVASVIAYIGLTVTFGFPGVLRLDAAEILAAFRAQEGWVRGFYYLFAIAHLSLAAGVLLTHRALSAGDGPWLAVATGGGVLYAVAQTAGFLRWPMLVPLFADRMAGDVSPIEADATLLVLDAFHHYAGVAIGENLSFFGFAAWLIGVGATLRAPALGHPRLGCLWIATGMGVLAYTFEQLGGSFAALAPLLILSHGLAYGLMLALSWSFLRTRHADQQLAPVGVAAGLTIAALSTAIIAPAYL